MTPLAAATATPFPTGTVLAVLAVLAAGYVLACALWPYTTCSSCQGSGRRSSPTGAAWRTCGRCAGRGSRLRLGRRLWSGQRDR